MKYPCLEVMREGCWKVGVQKQCFFPGLDDYQGDLKVAGPSSVKGRLKHVQSDYANPGTGAQRKMLNSSVLPQEKKEGREEMQV